MGIKRPDNPNPNYCPGLGFYQDKTPEFMVVSFYQIQKGASWLPEHGEPLNGLYQLPFVSCGYYEGIFAESGVRIRLNGPNFELYLWNYVYLQQFSAINETMEIIVVDNRITDTNWIWYGGKATLYMFMNGTQVPPVWTPGELVVMPATDKSYAEELIPTQFARSVRYVDNSTKSNVKMIGDF